MLGTLTIRLSGIDPDSNNDLTTAFIKDPEGGHLVQTQSGWSFRPDAGFTGRVEIPFTVYDGIASDDGLVIIDVMGQ